MCCLSFLFFGHRQCISLCGGRCMWAREYLSIREAQTTWTRGNVPGAVQRRLPSRTEVEQKQDRGEPLFSSKVSSRNRQDDQSTN